MDYGKILKLTFDRKVYNVSSKEKTRFRLINFYGEYIYPTDVTRGATDNEVYLHFNDINGLVFPAYLECLQTIAMGSDYVSIGAFMIEIFLDKLWPVPLDVAYLELSTLEVSGTIALNFDGKAYFDEHLQLSSVAVAGTNVLLTFYKRYFDDGHIALSTVSVAGQYCDVNGNPL